VIDSVLAGARWSLRANVPPGRAQAGFDVPWQGLSGELSSLGISN